MRLPVTDVPPTPKRADELPTPEYDHLKEVMEDDRFPYGQNAGPSPKILNAIVGSLPLNSRNSNGSACTNGLRRSTLN
jgi:hypothetical protein